MLTFFEELEFDLPTALIAELVALFKAMPQGALTEAEVAKVSNEQGVYQLFLDGALVYIGKTDADAGLQLRLKRHSKRITGRVGLDPSRVTFKAVRVFVFSAMDLEQLLISHYGLTSTNSWNNSGFGSNDPGRERDTTKLKVTHFDKQFPADYSLVYDVSAGGQPQTVESALRTLRSLCPYLIRFETSAPKARTPHPDLLSTSVTLPSVGGESVETILRRIKGALGNDWQITLLPAYVIGYKESRAYPEGKVLTPLP